ncbi:hypothetical protein [Paraburkholderia lycopersici]|uniref:Hydroxypyruvate isomerase n=1 Tax=Paraburkholderia lycopersici TaxID=416944 RepID=A0A1G6SLD8_9BURK|nr:hypothetical protein [Paraburkholderia lycopersici]SDD17603.1 hydroxypyruvate isomerase [Paraburkholderia lycopersici]
MIERLRASLPHPAHVHVHVQTAGNPGRSEPGTGEIRQEWGPAEIERSGYAGLIGCEYVPSGAGAQRFGWLEPLSAAKPA